MSLSSLNSLKRIKSLSLIYIHPSGTNGLKSSWVLMGKTLSASSDLFQSTSALC